MPWIFSSFLVAPCVLTSCHVVISKQGTRVQQVCKRKETTWLDLDKVQRIAVEQETSFQGGASVGTPWLLEEEVLALSICLSNHLLHTTETSTL